MGKLPNTVDLTKDGVTVHATRSRVARDGLVKCTAQVYRKERYGITMADEDIAFFIMKGTEQAMYDELVMVAKEILRDHLTDPLPEGTITGYDMEDEHESNKN